MHCPTCSHQLEAFLTMAPMTVGETIGMLVFGGVLPRHPDLRVVIAEGGIGWLAYYVLRHDLSEHEEGHRAALRESAGCRPAGDALRQRGEGLRTERVEQPLAYHRDLVGSRDVGDVRGDRLDSMLPG